MLIFLGDLQREDRHPGFTMAFVGLGTSGFVAEHEQVWLFFFFLSRA